MHRSLATMALALTVAAPARAFLTDSDAHPAPAMPRPGYLEPFVDPVFGETVIRITDSEQPIFNPNDDPSLVGQVWGREAGHGYSSRPAWNADGSLLMMEKGVARPTILDGRTYVPLYMKTFPGYVEWHPTDPHLLVYVSPNRGCAGYFSVQTQATLWERCYSGYDNFQWGNAGKGKPTVDGNIIPMHGQRQSDGHWVAFQYHVDSDRTSSEIDMSVYMSSGPAPGGGPEYDLSPLGDTIIIEGCLPSGCEMKVAVDVATGNELWREDQYRHNPGHDDLVLDAGGQQWVVGVSKAGPYAGQMIRRNLRTGAIVPVWNGWAAHVSTRNLANPAIAIFTKAGAAAPAEVADEVIGAYLDGSGIERYAHMHTVLGGYLAEGHACASRDGSKIVFRSNWDVGGGPIDAYVIEIQRGSPPLPGMDAGPPPDDLDSGVRSDGGLAAADSGNSAGDGGPATGDGGNAARDDAGRDAARGDGGSRPDRVIGKAGCGCVLVGSRAHSPPATPWLLLGMGFAVRRHWHRRRRT